MRLLKNKLYMTVILAICVEIYIIGFMTFMPKFMESYYGLTASKASMITGNTNSILLPTLSSNGFVGFNGFQSRNFISLLFVTTV